MKDKTIDPYTEANSSRSNILQREKSGEMNRSTQQKMRNIYEIHEEEVRQPRNKKYHNQQSTQEVAITNAPTERQHFDQTSKVVHTLLRQETKDVGKVILQPKKPMGIKTFKHDSSGSRLGFGEVQIKQPANTKAASNFWVDEGKGRSPVRNTKTWATSKEFQLGNDNAPRFAAGSNPVVGNG